MKKVQDRSISNDRAECEVCVAVNGPLLQHADSVIRACPEGDVQEQERHEEQGREVYQYVDNIKLASLKTYKYLISFRG